jgi:hypothetical protein
MNPTWQHRIYRSLRRLTPIVLNDGAAASGSTHDASIMLKN